MKTLNISISDVEYSKFGLTNDTLSFSEFVDMISKELMKKNLDDAIMEADSSNLSTMTMEAITEEVQAVRQNAKSNN